MRKRKDRSRRWPGIALAVVLTAVGVGQEMGSVWAGEPAADGEEIVILYTNDVHCRVDEQIGYAGLALYKQQAETETPYVALVDAGDAIQGAPIGTLSEGEYLTDLMNYVGYDVAVPGNHEFDYGVPRFLELANKLECGYYSCNFMDLRTGKTVFEPCKMEEYGDVQVAFLGITTPESFSKSSPRYFQDEAGNFIYGFCEDDTGNALYTQVQNAVDQARAEGADYVIAVGHLGENGVTPYWSSDAVVAATHGIDAVIDGHSHETVAAKILKNKKGNEVLISQTGTQLENIGKMTIQEDGSITAELISEVPAVSGEKAYQVRQGDSLARVAQRELGSQRRWREIFEANRDMIRNPNIVRVGLTIRIPWEARITEEGKAVDAATKAYIEEIKSQYEESMKVVLGKNKFLLTTKDPVTGLRAVRNKETNLGDFCADAFRNVLEADIGFMNGGGIRSDLQPGNITYYDALAVYPYGNMACVIQVTGQQIKDALEMACRYYPEESGSFMHVSGITYVIHSSVPSSVVTDDKGSFVRVDGEYRVSEIFVNGEALDLGRTYTLASHNYMLKEGGDGMSMFENSEIIRDEVMTDVDVLSAYISRLPDETVGEEYADPAGQGRIKIQ